MRNSIAAAATENRERSTPVRALRAFRRAVSRRRAIDRTEAPREFHFSRRRR